MHPGTEVSDDVIELTRSIAKREIAPHAADVDARSRFPEESMNALRRAGLLGLLVPRKLGGMGEGVRAMTGVLEEIARECSSTALCYLVHLAGAATYAASDPPKDDLLRAVARGEHLSSLALGEFGSRSHFWAPMSRPVRENGKLVLNASKSFVTSAGHVDGYAVLTGSTEEDPGTREGGRSGGGGGRTGDPGTTFYYVPGDDPGVRAASSWDALGMRGNASAPMTFRNVTVSPEQALCEPGGGMDMLLGTVLPLVNLGVSAICLGIGEATVEITRDHLLKTRLQHLSMRLADLPNERARLARMRLETDRTRAHLSGVLDAVEADREDAVLLVLESKLAAAETALRVTDIGMKAVGGTAFNRRLGLERRFRDARAADFLGITSDMLLEFIGRALCGMPVP